MLKIMGSLIVIAGTTVIGFAYANIYVQRVKQLREMQYALSMMETEISYTSTPLIEALYSVGEKSDNAIGKLLTGMANRLKERKQNDVYEAFVDCLTEIKDELYLNKEEKDVLAAFIKALGNSDIEGQKKNFNITIKKLEGFEKRADEVRVKNQQLFRYLGVCLGVLIVIILV